MLTIDVISRPTSPYFIAGVDEVGRGPLAGAVVAAAVILNPKKPIAGLLDSKLLDESTREILDKEIRAKAVAYCIAEASVAEIDQLNILHASMLAMQRAVEGLGMSPNMVLVDGNRCPGMAYPCQAIVKGDQHVQAISAASIIAKVNRDRQMVELHKIHPEFGFNRHKGYPTAQHRAAIMEHGILPMHRRSFAPVRNALMAEPVVKPMGSKVSKEVSDKVGEEVGEEVGKEVAKLVVEKDTSKA